MVWGFPAAASPAHRHRSDRSRRASPAPRRPRSNNSCAVRSMRGHTSCSAAGLWHATRRDALDLLPMLVDEALGRCPAMNREPTIERGHR